MDTKTFWKLATNQKGLPIEDEYNPLEAFLIGADSLKTVPRLYRKGGESNW